MEKAKNSARKELKRKRNRLSKAFINRASIDIFKAFKQEFAPGLKKNHKIMVYMSAQSEVKTRGIITYLLRKNHKLYVPAVMDGKIVPVRLLKDSKIRKGPYKIPEPVKKQKLNTPSSLNMIIVPGIGFDLRGNRLGFGGGFFDAFLKKTGKKPLKIALSFSKQIRKKIPAARNDIKMDYIITEREILKTSRAAVKKRR